MLVLIDESGCTGFKLAKGSSAHFVLAMVIFHSYEVAEQTSCAISNLRFALGVKSEFKFSKLNGEFRDRFFNAVSKFDFQVRALVVEKASVYNPMLRNDKDSFYNYFLKTLINHDQGVMENASTQIFTVFNYP